MNPRASVRLGNTDVTVTRMGLGGAALGNLYTPVEEEVAEATIAGALGRGIRYFDTAPYYGYGLAEERLGVALANHGALEKCVVSSKVGRRLVPRTGGPRSDQGFFQARPFDPVFDYSHDGVMRSYEASLERLGRPSIEILLMHDLGALTHGEAEHPELLEIAMKGGLKAMQRLKEEGAVGAIGLGVNEARVCLEVLERAQLDCLLLAGRYTLLEQDPLDDLLPLCEARQVSLIVGGPFNSGVLVEAPGVVPHYDYEEAAPEIVHRVARLREVCRAHQVPLAAAALQFPLCHPAVAAVIPGARNEREVAANLEWLEFAIPDALYRDLRGEGLLHPEAPTDAPL